MCLQNIGYSDLFYCEAVPEPLSIFKGKVKRMNVSLALKTPADICKDIMIVSNFVSFQKIKSAEDNFKMYSPAGFPAIFEIFEIFTIFLKICFTEI